MEIELWKDIPGYEGYYQISNFGRIKSLKRYCYCYLAKKKKRLVKERILKLRMNNRGYVYFNIKKKNDRLAKQLHRFVYEIFKGKIPEDMGVYHLDKNRWNNRLDNLALRTIKGKNTIKIKKRILNQEIFKVDQFNLNKEFIKSYFSFSNASRITNTNLTSLKLCCEGKQKTAGGYIWKYHDRI